MLSASGSHGLQVWCSPGNPSIPYQLQKPAVVLTDLPRFLERAGALVVEATEVALDILDVVFEVATDDVAVVTGCLRIAWQEGTGWREAGVRETRPGGADQKGHSL